MKQRPDIDPGFWCEYVPPKNAVSRLVQQPSDAIDGFSLADAYMRDERASRAALSQRGTE